MIHCNNYGLEQFFFELVFCSFAVENDAQKSGDAVDSYN